MIQNYIKVSFRSLIRNKVSTITSLIGLSISMVVGVLLFAMVKSNWETPLKLLLISGIFGVPLGWFCSSLLKTRFASHADLGLSNLLTGYAIVLFVAMVVVISQTFRSMYINPAKVLRGE